MLCIIFTAIESKVNEWKERKEAILRGEAPPSEFVHTEETEQDIYKVEEHQVSPIHPSIVIQSNSLNSSEKHPEILRRKGGVIN